MKIPGKKADDGKASMATFVDTADAPDDVKRNGGGGNGPADAAAPIPKPGAFDLNKFKSKRADAIQNTQTLQTGLPVHNISAGEGLRAVAPGRRALLVVELCFVNVPIKGQKRDTLHLIDEELGNAAICRSGKILRFRLALATKPHDVSFSARPEPEPGQHWNKTNVCGRANRQRRIGCR